MRDMQYGGIGAKANASGTRAPAQTPNGSKPANNSGARTPNASCIAGSVGKGGLNSRDDVVVVQVLLNIGLSRIDAFSCPVLAVTPDGKCGPQTIGAIERFQSKQLIVANGRVDPGCATLSALQSALPDLGPLLCSADGTDELQIPDLMFLGIMPRARWQDIEKYASLLRSDMPKHDIYSPLRVASFLAQIGEETGALRYSEEIASGANYEGRKDLGNNQPGDGPRFKGRGLIMLTGRDNYTDYGQAIKRNLTDGSNPGLVASDPSLAVDSACWFWQSHGLNAKVETEGVDEITRVVNGGLNGLGVREQYFIRALFFLKVRATS